MKHNDTLQNDQVEFQKFIEPSNTLFLATVDEQGNPHASIAPFVRDEDGNFYIYLSGLALHSLNIKANQKADILFRENESRCETVFSCQRLRYQCRATVSEFSDEILKKFQNLSGEIIDNLRQLPDFTLFKLDPVDGRFIAGFGRAYRINIKKNKLEQIKMSR